MDVVLRPISEWLRWTSEQLVDPVRSLHRGRRTWVYKRLRRSLSRKLRREPGVNKICCIFRLLLNLQNLNRRFDCWIRKRNFDKYGNVRNWLNVSIASFKIKLPAVRSNLSVVETFFGFLIISMIHSVRSAIEICEWAQTNRHKQ